jgi:amino-acid N-acetyltransferase
VLRVTPGATIRPARPDDLGAALALLAELGLPAEGVAEWWHTFIVAETNAGLVGLAGLELYPDGALLRSVAVHPKAQGTGLGRRLVGRALAGAGATRARAVYLLTTTAADWFPRFGFTVTGRDSVPASIRESVEFREACPSGATVMRRDL